MSLDEDPHFRVPSFGTLYFGGRDSTQTALTAQLPLFTGGRLQGLAGQAKAGLTASEGANLRQRQRVAYDATIAYLGARKAQELVKVAQAQLEALQSQRDSIAKMVDRGVSPRLDLLRAETGLAAAQSGLTSARNGEAVALAALTTAMGLQADPGITLAADPGPDEPSNPGNASLPPDLKAAVDEAARQRPELTQASAGVRAARSGVKVARSSLLPTVGAFAQYDAARYSTMPKTGLWSAGVTVSMNLFDSGATQADVARAKAQVTQAQAAEAELRNGISLEVTQAFLDVGSAKERLTTAQRGAAAAEEGLRLVQTGYQNGVNTITDFLAAQAELTQAQTSVATARHDVSAAEAGLRFALGRGG
jgi:outer membrane protein TolC